MRTLILSLFLATLMVASPLQASPLDDARNSGQVVEMPDGYIRAEGKATPAIQTLVEDVNKRRLAAYERIAKKNGITTAQVAAESYRKRMKKS